MSGHHARRHPAQPAIQAAAVILLAAACRSAATSTTRHDSYQPAGPKLSPGTREAGPDILARTRRSRDPGPGLIRR
jgi:hypothetical protein